MNIKILLQYIFSRCLRILNIRALGLPSKLPRWGRFAEALLLWNKPFQAGLSKQDTILNWTNQAELPHVHDTDVPPATVQFAKMNSWKGQRAALMTHFDTQGIIADTGEFTQLVNSLELTDGSIVFADKGYSSKKNNEFLKSKNVLKSALHNAIYW